MGALLDAIPVMLIFFPVLLPIAMQLGIDPTHFGVGHGPQPDDRPAHAADRRVAVHPDEDRGHRLRGVARASLAPHARLLAVLMIITFVPQLVLWIPNLVL
jgi:TRAP-type C4-dicarboxylate transport system permease large subunit